MELRPTFCSSLVENTATNLLKVLQFPNPPIVSELAASSAFGIIVQGTLQPKGNEAEPQISANVRRS